MCYAARCKYFVDEKRRSYDLRPNLIYSVGHVIVLFVGELPFRTFCRVGPLQVSGRANAADIGDYLVSIYECLRMLRKESRIAGGQV